MNFSLSTSFKRRAIAAAAVLTLAGAAVAGTATGTNDFSDVANKLRVWMEGSLGKTFAIGSLAVGLAIGVVKQSVMSVVTGVAVALSASVGPGVLVNLFTAVM